MLRVDQCRSKANHSNLIAESSPERLTDKLQSNPFPQSKLPSYPNLHTHQKAQEARCIAVLGATGVAQTNAGLEKMLVELRNELHQMRTKIEGAEERANTAQRIANSAYLRANDARSAADAA